VRERERERERLSRRGSRDALVWFEGKGVSTSRVSPTRSTLNIIWSRGLFEGKGLARLAG
jgi:hypothetical protein